jgi:hypothetical protein
MRRPIVYFSARPMMPVITPKITMALTAITVWVASWVKPPP